MSSQTFESMTKVYFRCHEIVRENIKKQTGRYPRKYKRFERVRINKLFITLPYKNLTLGQFASSTTSKIIVTHGLPNANHRTTILFISLILERLGISFPQYSKKRTKKKWHEECNTYIRKSKRILRTRKTDSQYKEKHLQWTDEWLMSIIGTQSKSSGSMSKKLLTTLAKSSSSWVTSSLINFN